MTAYFDEKAREAREICRRFKDDSAMLETLAELEEPMIHEVSLLTGDREFPDELRERIQTAIALYRVKQPAPDLPENKGPDWARTMRESGLVERLHSLFHEVAGRRIRTRHGLLLDSPIGFLRERGDR